MSSANLNTIILELYKMEPVSESEATKAGERLVDRLSNLRTRHEATQCLCEIVGFVATCHQPELNRRLIVWESNHGPFLKD